jgi:enoyl-CoA hydratase/carnithine racemase
VSTEEALEFGLVDYVVANHCLFARELADNLIEKG